jgi:hypothetical protein
MDTVQVVGLVKALLQDTADVQKTGSTIDEADSARLAPDKTAKQNVKKTVNKTNYNFFFFMFEPTAPWELLSHYFHGTTIYN